MPHTSFEQFFHTATGQDPFPWQAELFKKFAKGEFPSTASIPTGLGKTSIVAIWLVALALHPDRVPRRLVYVVNRRTVVDQTSTEVQRLRDALKMPALAEICGKLQDLCALPLPTPDAPPLALSTLRGQFADNGEWCADPSRPAVVVGTVDMIGSGLLFSRYARGFKTRPLHAGFLAQDALLVHDEAHLEPAFQTLLGEIETAQRESNEFRPLRVLELTATSRAENKNGESPFTLTDADLENETVQKRINAVKRLSLSTLVDGKNLSAKLLTLAKEKIGERAVLIFARSVESVIKITAELDKGERKEKVATLTGTMRGKERDELVSTNPVFQRFLPEKDRAKNVVPAAGTVYLVATSAGEVGVNISADDLVCDLSTYESMAQRFGRMNRFGHRDDSRITVVHETKFDTAKPLEAARERTLALLKKLDGDASPTALDKLPADARTAAFSPLPEIRVATAVQFDAWALTSIRKPIAARPSVAPYLHGEAEWQPPETHIAWRDDRDFQHIKDPEAFLDDFPLKSAELLRDTSDRISETLGGVVATALQKGNPLPNAWLIDEFGNAKAVPLAPFALSAKPKKERTKDEEEELKRVKEFLAGATLLLPAAIGGLDTNGLFNGKGDTAATDVSGIIRHESTNRDELPDGAAKIVHISEISDEAAEEPRFLLWCNADSESAAGNTPPRRRPQPETLAAHTNAVAANTTAIAAKILPDTSALAAGEPDLRHCLVVAARLHDLGKNRAQWQRNLGNLAYDPGKPETILAKSTHGMRPRNVAEHYRHEFGSLNDAERDPGAKSALADLSDLERDIALHLIAAHHGRGRPHFPENEIFDYSANADVASALATEIPRRFARLQHHFGRWGLAWLESLLRAADYAASAGIVAQANPSISVQAATPSQVEQSPNTPQPAPTATLAVNPANPGHYFACCGLFGLASRLSPDALAWFEQDSTTRQWRFHLANTLPLSDLLEKITTAELSAENDEPEGEEETDEDADEKESEKEAVAPPLRIGEPFNLRLDWWTTALPGTSALKVWAGSMKVLRIAISMRQTIHEIVQSSPMDLGRILFDARISLDPFKIKKEEEKSAAQYEADLKAAYAKRDEALNKAVAEKAGEKLEKEKTKIEAKYSEACAKAVKKRDDNVVKARAKAKTEPFCFDANRGPNSDARDVGFSPNDLKLRTLAAPAAEFLTLAGLQCAIPQPSGDRLFDYHLWQTPVPGALLAAAINGFTDPRPQQSFRFESWYRTSQRKHKAFLLAKSL